MIQAQSTDNNIPCLFDFGKGKEYLTACDLESGMSGEACNIMKPSCQSNICQHLIPNSTKLTQPPTLDPACFYPNPAEPPCMKQTLQCSAMFPLPSVWDIKMALSIIISFVLVTYFGMLAGLFYLSRHHLNMQKSIWLHGTESSHYKTQTDGHEEPTWNKLFKDIYFPWLTHIYLPYFTPCCSQASAEGGAAAFVDDADGESDA